MWHRRLCRDILLTLAGLLWLCPTLPAETLQGKVRWSGDVILKETVTVAPGAVLTLAPGTRVTVQKPGASLSVRGRLLVQGSPDAPVRFEGVDGWLGIELVEAVHDSRFEHVQFRRGLTAISSIATNFTVRQAEFREFETAIKLLRESGPVIEDSLFDGNGLGVDNEMKSSPVIRNNRFLRHSKTAVLASHNSAGPISGNRFEKNQQGVALIQRYSDRIHDNHFVDNEIGLFCNQTQNTPTIEDNRFEQNRKAIVNASFSYPAIRNNAFAGNGTAIHNDQYGSPLVDGNNFRDNETALYNYRKSNPKVQRNLFEANRLALFCDYSSYPEVRNNHFIENAMAVKLGIYQSADWEKRSGSKAIIMREAAARKSQNPLLSQAPTEFADFVDVSGNWWGPQTAELAKADAESNLPMFHDRKDQPEVVYEDFGPEAYRLDRVVYQPVLKGPVAEVGRRETP